MMYWEDFEPGQRFEMGEHTFTEEEIIAFARQFDPQPFHVDPRAAKESFFGGLIASGWHTCAIMMRISVEAMQRERAAGAGSPGIDSCRWLKPVRPGDTLTLKREILEAWPSRTKPIGFVRSRSEMVNQKGETVLAIVGITMLRRRPDTAA